MFSLRSSDKKPASTPKLAFDRKSRLIAQSKDTYCLVFMIFLFCLYQFILCRRKVLHCSKLYKVGKMPFLTKICRDKGIQFCLYRQGVSVTRGTQALFNVDLL
ncbi:MAG: hypothetical protein D3925_01655 [Candidatus Electrothrix sp. AR5]|nr:hypothetical protein [Candidatus Electrothrix sp. AR5]